MSASRWTTVGIAVGGVGGAVAALLGAPLSPPRPAAPAARAGESSEVSAAAPAPESENSVAAEPAASAAPPQASVSATPQPSPSIAIAPEGSASAAPPEASASAAPPEASASAAPPEASASAAPASSAAANLEPPTTAEGLLAAEMLCDRRLDFDECTRAAVALETGTAGPANAEQGRRFRKIALTHMVKQCEGGSPHACFVLAGKYRSGEIAGSAARIEALEARAKELCRSRPGPECPTP